ncbi:MAG: peroxiredoxin [Gammaproteobacteria bacterium]|nr:MAG: peroxiredoxin [Gammaproteobacteria bacterium]
MPKAVINKAIPAAGVIATGDQEFKLSSLKGQYVVLYFYPKDSTSGCTKEGVAFRDHYRKFRNQDAVILGVSRDSLKSHENFKAKYKFPFELISDADEKLCKIFNVIKEKNMYGRKVMGIERSTFIIDPKGMLRREYRKVKVDGHVEQVLQDLKALRRQ